MVSQELLAILACPQCKGDLEYLEDCFLCQACKLKYPIRDGIPVMLIEEAEKIELRTES